MTRRPRPLLAALTLPVLLASFSGALPGSLPEASAASSSQLELAIAAYSKDLDFDRAITSLTSLLQGGTLTKNEQVRAWEYLALAHIAKGKEHYGEARKAIRTLVQLDPNLRPDPDRLHPEFMKIYFGVAKEEGLLEERADPGIKTIAVLDFDNNSVEDHEKLEPLRGGFADMLVTDLSRLTTLRVVERERVRFILDELDLEQTEKFDPATAARIGKMLGVHCILIGSYSKIGGKMRLDTRLVRTETGELLKADQITKRTDDFFQLIDDAAILIAKDLDVKVSEAERGAIGKDDNRSMDALLRYSEGLEYYDRGDYRKAYEKFQEALKVNPDYERAGLRLAALKPLVG
jgi:TolB-like protein